MPSAWPQVPDSEGKHTTNFILKRDLQITNANKVPARPPGPLPSLPLRWRAAHVHTLHPQAMGIESAQVGGSCGCTHLGVVRGARQGRAGPKRRVPGYPPFRGSCFVTKRRVRWLPSVCRRGSLNIGLFTRQLSNPGPAWAPINRQRLSCPQATLCR